MALMKSMAKSKSTGSAKTVKGPHKVKTPKNPVRRDRFGQILTTKKISVALEFVGSGKVEENRHGTISGGVAFPKDLNRISYGICRELKNRYGVYNPPFVDIKNGVTTKGAFQVNITSDSKGYRALGKYFLAIAELDTTADDGFHEHHEDLMSDDGRARFHIIIRKNKM